MRSICKKSVAALSITLLSGSLSACALDGEELTEEELLVEEEEEVGSDSSEIFNLRNPVIFVHGCNPPGVTPEQVYHLWDPMVATFQSRGYPESYLRRFEYSGPQCDSIIDHAVQLEDFVRQVQIETRRIQVDIVAHSMGALVTRLYIRQGGFLWVQDFAMVAGANHGGEGAAPGVFLQGLFGAPAFEGMKEMFPPYACEGEASGGAADIQFELNGCLTPTGRTVWRDETPWFVDYLSIRNTLDDTVIPVESACLNQRFQNDCSSNVNEAVTVGPGPGSCPGGICPPHVALMFDPTVIDMVYDHVRPGLFD